MQWIFSLLLRCSFYHSIKSNGKSRHSYIWLAECAISCPEISTCKLWKGKQNRRGKMFGNGNVIWHSLKSDDGAIAILTTSCGSVFVVSPTYKRLVNLRDEWVSERVSDGNFRIPILTLCWPDVSQCYLLFVSDHLSSSICALETHLSSHLLWFVGYVQ